MLQSQRLVDSLATSSLLALYAIPTRIRCPSAYPCSGCSPKLAMIPAYTGFLYTPLSHTPVSAKHTIKSEDEDADCS